VYAQVGLRRDALTRALLNEREATLTSIGRRLSDVEQRARGLERMKERARQLLADPSNINGVEWDAVPDLGPCSIADGIAFSLDQSSIDNAISAVERIRREDDLSFSMSFFAALM
jgi:hypothetical protein